MGHLRLVPRAGADARSAVHDHGELGDARLIDYSAPGFAVVYVEGTAPLTQGVLGLDR